MAAASMCSSQKRRTSATACVDDRRSLRASVRDREKQRAVEMAEEQGLGEAERLGPREEQFLGLLLLLGEFILCQHHVLGPLSLVLYPQVSTCGGGCQCRNDTFEATDRSPYSQSAALTLAFSIVYRNFRVGRIQAAGYR